MSKELKTGIVSILIIVAFIWGYNFLKGQDIFQPSNRHFKVEYSNVGGLTEASFVTINGLKVGQVSNIDFNSNPEKRGSLIVGFFVDNDIEFSKNSIVKIYSPNPLAGSSLAIIPKYDDEIAQDGDYLQGEIEPGLLSSIGERLDPIQTKLEHVMVSADTLFQKINHLLDDSTTQSIKRSIRNLENTITDIRSTLKSFNGIIDSNSVALNETINNSKKITQNLANVSDTLANANIGEIMRKTEFTLKTVNSLLDGVNKGEGTVGKLIKDEQLYNNLTAMSKELEELLRDMKMNPKRFVHFSLFGKKPKPYTPTEKDSIKIKN